MTEQDFAEAADIIVVHEHDLAGYPAMFTAIKDGNVFVDANDRTVTLEAIIDWSDAA